MPRGDDDTIPVADAPLLPSERIRTNIAGTQYRLKDLHVPEGFGGENHRKRMEMMANAELRRNDIKIRLENSETSYTDMDGLIVITTSRPENGDREEKAVAMDAHMFHELTHFLVTDPKYGIAFLKQATKDEKAGRKDVQNALGLLGEHPAWDDLGEAYGKAQAAAQELAMLELHGASKEEIAAARKKSKQANKAWEKLHAKHAPDMQDEIAEWKRSITTAYEPSMRTEMWNILEDGRCEQVTREDRPGHFHYISLGNLVDPRIGNTYKMGQDRFMPCPEGYVPVDVDGNELTVVDGPDGKYLAIAEGTELPIWTDKPLDMSRQMRAALLSEALPEYSALDKDLHPDIRNKLEDLRPRIDEILCSDSQGCIASSGEILQELIDEGLTDLPDDVPWGERMVKVPNLSDLLKDLQDMVDEAEGGSDGDGNPSSSNSPSGQSSTQKNNKSDSSKEDQSNESSEQGDDSDSGQSGNSKSGENSDDSKSGSGSDSGESGDKGDSGEQDSSGESGSGEQDSQQGGEQGDSDSEASDTGDSGSDSSNQQGGESGNQKSSDSKSGKSGDSGDQGGSESGSGDSGNQQGEKAGNQQSSGSESGESGDQGEDQEGSGSDDSGEGGESGSESGEAGESSGSAGGQGGSQAGESGSESGDGSESVTNEMGSEQGSSQGNSSSGGQSSPGSPGGSGEGSGPRQAKTPGQVVPEGAGERDQDRGDGADVDLGSVPIGNASEGQDKSSSLTPEKIQKNESSRKGSANTNSKSGNSDGSDSGDSSDGSDSGDSSAGGGAGAGDNGSDDGGDDDLTKAKNEKNADFENDAADQTDGERRRRRKGHIDGSAWESDDNTNITSLRDLGGESPLPKGGDERKYSRKLHSQLEEIRNASIAPATRQRSGRVDKKRMTRLSAGDDRIFKKPGRELDTEIVTEVLLDISGSMSNELENLRSATMTTHYAMKDLGLPHSVWGFEGNSQKEIKSITRDGPGAIGRIPKISDHGGTPTAEAVEFARARLSLRQEDAKVMLVFTDGHPNNMEKTKSEVRKAKEQGLVVLGCCFEQGSNHLESSMKEIFEDDYMMIDDLSEMPRFLGRKIKKLIEGGVGRR